MHLPHHRPDGYYDYLGQEIVEGDFVVYSTASGSSSAVCSLARVDKLDLKKPGHWNPPYKPGGKPYWTLPEFRISITVLMDGYGRVKRWDAGLGTHVAQTRKTTLTKNRTLVLVPDLPQSLVRALENEGIDLYV